MITADLDQDAAAWVIGLVRGDQRAALAARQKVEPGLGTRVQVWEELLAGFDQRAVAVAPPDDLFEAILGGIDQAGAGLPGTRTIRAAAGVWSEISPGVSTRILREDTVLRRRSLLLRIAPGACYLPHRHDQGEEECLVIEGDLAFGDLRLFPGDFHVAEPGTNHPAPTSVNGCLLYITTAM